MTKQQLSHLIRIAAIVVLLAGAVVLCWQSGYFSGARLRPDPDGGAEEGPVLQLTAAEKAALVCPDAVLVHRAGGAACAAEYSAADVQAVVQLFAPILGEALGTAGNPEHISEESFRAALAENSVYLHFPCRAPLRLLADWLGSGMTGAAADIQSELICLCAAGDKTALCFRDSTGQFFRCATAAVAETVRARIAEELAGES